MNKNEKPITCTVKKSDHPRSWTYQSTRWSRSAQTTVPVWRSTRRGSERPDGRSIIYLSIVGENMLENLENRHSRPHVLLRPLIEEQLRAQGVTFTKLRWSQTAGCSCPCSPGYLMHGATRGIDYWAEVTM